MTHNTSFSNRTDTSSRRSVLTSIATVGAIGVAGCLGDDEDAPTEPDRGPFADIRIEGLDIVIELDRDADPIEVVNVIDPTGSLFTQQRIEAGVTRKTVQLGTSYVPGMYEFVALVDDEPIGSTEHKIEPELEIVDLKLGRDHPDEMYENATSVDTITNAIVTVKNSGSGPTGITKLQFEGDVPFPTRDSYEDSGIYDTDRGFGDADFVDAPHGRETVLYSNTRPFLLTSNVVECTPDTTEGIFFCRIITSHPDLIVSKQYAVQYTGESLPECEIAIEEQNP
ncbi:hypothetical protein [Natronocalculus amylovorans]|uniref:Uncharacterized protein n=1 Tax=Natronocalculus amylovorans TaxID=2917812 RepID=A0AAE3FY99_9EURY|nr:hypothetical protein [Natronocalculus amylovorans]MCL9817516.1 hypothetical protein [Natronocalculus amylovorans]